MRTPDSLQSLVDDGVIDEVVRPLMSGKEAQVYLVRGSGELRVAKVYKEAQHRSFKQRAEYTEGRNVRNSRDQRAMSKRTRHGRDRDEAAWRSAEVDMIYRLRTAGVRVPVPYHFVDGVLIMELVTGADGHPAPRLGDLSLDREAATQVFEHLLAEVIRMLAAGVVHGDLSDFNVLMGSDGPVIIDFPQAVDASSNQNARKLLLRDVDNLHRFMAKIIPGRQPPPFAQEMWLLYERGELTADSKLSGRYKASEKQANTEHVLSLIADAEHDERKRREAQGIRMRPGNTPTFNHTLPSTHAQARGPVSTRMPLQSTHASGQAQPSRAQPGRAQPSKVQSNTLNFWSSSGQSAPRVQPRSSVPPARRSEQPPPVPDRRPPQADATQGGALGAKRKRRRRRRKSKAGTATTDP